MPKVPSSSRAILTELWRGKVCGLSFINLWVSASELGARRTKRKCVKWDALAVFIYEYNVYPSFILSPCVNLYARCISFACVRSVYTRRPIGAAGFSRRETRAWNNRISKSVKFSRFIYTTAGNARIKRTLIHSSYSPHIYFALLYWQTFFNTASLFFYILHRKAF